VRVSACKASMGIVLALLGELFLGAELSQPGYESYRASERPVCIGIRLILKLTNG
jgi:hypothetical protein